MTAQSSLSRLALAWGRIHQDRAMGGVWAHAGFAYQTAVFLNRFFTGKSLEQEQFEPGEAAEIELLSDVLAPSDRLVRIVQVKRTLNASALKAAVQEAYLLMKLCFEVTPDLVSRLRFQIVCRKREVKSSVFDLEPDSVIEPSVDRATWNAMLTAFEPTQPIVVEQDAFERLYVLLWSLGVEDPWDLIVRMVGRVHAAFDVAPAQVRQIGQQLWSDFAQVRRRELELPELPLTVAELMPNPDCKQRVLVGSRPQLQHLRDGCFKIRPRIQSRVLKTVSRFLDLLTNPDEPARVPVFWIGGRSFEGKSVLLLQTLASIVQDPRCPPVLQLPSGDKVPAVLTTLAARRHERAGIRAMLAVDDLYQVTNQENWEREVLDACALRTPRAAIVTCGTTDQRELFQKRFADVFDVVPCDVPKLDAAEIDEFIKWYEERTGKRVDASHVTRDNALVGSVVFELSRNQSLPDFARRFRLRLEAAGIYDAMRTIVAVNATNTEAPFSLVPEGRPRDVLERLCEEDLQHFRVTNVDGLQVVELAHNRLAWILFQAWVDPPTTIERAWARELAIVDDVLKHNRRDSDRLRLIGRAIAVAKSVSDVNAQEMLRELYAQQARRYGGTVDPVVLRKWLEVLPSNAGLTLDPSPIETAVAFMSDAQASSRLHGSVAARIWKLARHFPSRTAVLRQAAIDYLAAHPTAPGAVETLASIIRDGGDPRALSLADRWLNERGNDVAIHPLLVALLEHRPGQKSLIDAAVQWLQTYAASPGAMAIVTALATRNRGRRDIFDIAAAWCKQNIDLPQSGGVVSAVLAANRGLHAAHRLACHWLDAHPSFSGAATVLFTLAAALPHDHSIKERLLTWLEREGVAQRRFLILRFLVEHHATDPRSRTLIGPYLTSPTRPDLHALMTNAVKVWPRDEEVISAAVQWLTANLRHGHAYGVAKALMAACPDEPRVMEALHAWKTDVRSRRRASPNDVIALASMADETSATFAVDWVRQHATHGGAPEVLSALIANRPNDPSVQDAVFAWLDRFPVRPDATHLISTIARGNKGIAHVQDRILRWLDANSESSSIGPALEAILAANSENASVRQWFEQWLQTHLNHPAYAHVLRVGVGRIGSPWWLEQGEQYVRGPRGLEHGYMIIALVSGGQASPRHLDIALAHLGKRRSNDRARWVSQLRRTLLRFPNRVIHYLATNKPNKAHKLFGLLSAAALEDPSYIPQLRTAFEQACLPTWESKLLLDFTRVSPPPDAAVAWVATWLESNFHRPGYGLLLGRIISPPWRSLIEPHLTHRVKRDLARAHALPSPFRPEHAR